MSINREMKEKQVKELSEAFEQNSTYYLLDYIKIPVSKSMELRKNLRDQEFSIKVIKNRLALRALKEDTPEELKEHFQGPTAIAFTEKDPIQLARLLKDFTAQNRILKVKAGMIEGQYLAGDRFAEIANLSSRNDLIAKLGFMMAYPLTQFLKSLQAPMNSFGSMMGQLKSKK